MRKIYPILTKELKKVTTSKTIGKDDGYEIKTYRELVEHIAKLAYENKDHILFYRGQTKDYQNKVNNSSFYPTIYRGGYLKKDELKEKFRILDKASKLLIKEFKKQKIKGYLELSRKKYLQWSILQHYEVVDTPLIDVTQSLRVACSFATYKKSTDKSAYIYVFGLPYFTNRITINSEHDLVNIRLLSIAPPEALRPYFQEGYLIGTTDIIEEYESKNELDLNQRLFAKFKLINSDDFWDDIFKPIPQDLIYPANDLIKKICDNVKKNLEIK